MSRVKSGECLRRRPLPAARIDAIPAVDEQLRANMADNPTIHAEHRAARQLAEYLVPGN